MSTKIIKSNFNITAARVPSALAELKAAYPEITGLNYESDALNLQYIIYQCGFHTRVNSDGSIFTLSKLCTTNENNSLVMLNILAKYIDSNETVVANIDDNTYTFTNTGCVNVQSNEDTVSALVTDDKEEQTDPEEIVEDEIEETLIESVNNVSEIETIKAEPVIDSNVVKKNKGGRPRKEIKK